MKSRNLLGIRRFLAAAAAVLLMVLGSQAVLAQYQPSGSLVLSTTTPEAGERIGVSGTGYAPDSSVQVTIESPAVLLATVNADSSGAFHTQVTIPTTFSGPHTMYGIGIDSAGSVWILSADLTVTNPTAPPTDTAASPTGPDRSDPLVFALAGAGIVVMTGILLYRTRQRRPQG